MLTGCPQTPFIEDRRFLATHRFKSGDQINNNKLL